MPKESGFEKNPVFEGRRRLTEIAGDLLDHTGELSFDYGGQHILAKYDRVDMNYNGSQRVCLKTVSGEIIPIRTKEFFNLPEVNDLLKSKLETSDLEPEVLAAALDILAREGIEF